MGKYYCKLFIHIFTCNLQGDQMVTILRFKDMQIKMRQYLQM